MQSNTSREWMLIWTHCDTDDRVPGWWLTVPWRRGNVVIMEQRHHMRQGGEGDISHAVGLLNVNDHFSHLLPKKRSFEGKKKNNFTLFVTSGRQSHHQSND